MPSPRLCLRKSRPTFLVKLELMDARPVIDSAVNLAMVNRTCGAMVTVPSFSSMGLLLSLQHHGHHAAVHAQDLTAHVAGLLRGEKSDSVGYLLRCAWSLHRSQLQDVVDELLRQVRGLVGGYVAGGYGVDSDVASTKFPGHGLGKTDDARLGS